MDPLPMAADGDSAPPRRQQAWWLLAALSGQLDDRTSVPAFDSSADRASESGDGAGRFIGDSPPVAFDAAFFGWLVDAHDETASAFWDVLALVREWRASAPGGAIDGATPEGSGGA
jgi:hypothetical protein